MRAILNIGLIGSFLLCYIEWGGGQAAFIGGIAWHLLSEQKDPSDNLTHPLILAGLAGMLLLLTSAALPRPPKPVQWLGMILPGTVVLLVLLAGVLSGNVRMIVSVLPYLICCGLLIRHWRRRRQHESFPVS